MRHTINNNIHALYTSLLYTHVCPLLCSSEQAPSNAFAQFACANTKRIPSLKLQANTHTAASDMAAPSHLTEPIQSAHTKPPLKRTRVIADTPEATCSEVHCVGIAYHGLQTDYGLISNM